MISILVADPNQLRHMAQMCQDGANQLEVKAKQLNRILQDLLSGSDSWNGKGAQSFKIKVEALIEELQQESEKIRSIVPILHSLAFQVENIEAKKQELFRMESQRSSMHWGLNPSVDAEIAYLDSRILALKAEIETESIYADMSATAQFRAIRINESFQNTWQQINQEILSASHQTYENFNRYVKPAADWLWHGVEELLDIPEMVEAWNQLTDPNASMGERLLAAGKLIVDGALDISMLFGIGDLAKGAQLLAKFGMKYGAKLIAQEGRKEVAKTISDHLTKFAEGVASGAEKFFNRGLPNKFAFASSRGGTEAASKGYFHFAGKTADELRKVAKSPKSRLPRNGGRWEGEPGNGKWYSEHPDVVEVTKGEPVVFKDGRPDFSPWTKGRMKFEPGVMNGSKSDFQLVYDKIKEIKGFKNQKQAIDWLRERGLTPHHLDHETIQLVPTKLHKNVPHIGSASDMRGGN